MAVHELLKKCYALTASEDVKAFYDQHADSYDATLLEDIGYVAPRVSADVFNVYCTDKQASIIDLGCGTGLVGEALAQHGFTAIDGADYSAGMLRVAGRKNCYRALFPIDLNQAFAIEDDSYAAAISVGAFSQAHIRKEALAEAVRIVRPTGLVCIMLNEQALHAHGFYAEYQRLETAGIVKSLYLQEHDYHFNEGIKGWLSLLQVL